MCAELAIQALPAGEQPGPGLAPRPPLGLHPPAVGAGGPAQVSEELRVDEPGVGVVLHQAVNFPLRRHEAGGRGLLQALDDGVFGLEVQVDLQRHQSDPVSLGRFLICAAVDGRPSCDVKLSAFCCRHLFGSFAPDELFVDAVGFGRHGLRGRLRLEVLAGQPELHVLLAELGLEEDAKGRFAVCGGDKQI